MLSFNWSSLAQFLEGLAASLIAHNNPKLAPAIGQVTTVLQTETANVASGNATPVDAVHALAPGVLDLTAQVVAQKDPAHADTINGLVSVVAGAVNAAQQPTTQPPTS